MKKLPFFNDLIDVDVLLIGYFFLGVHDPINFLLFNVGRIDFYRSQLIKHIQSVQGRWKI